MGLKNMEDRTYLRIRYGRIVKPVPPGTEGAKMRKTNSGEVIYELTWESLSGILDNVTFRDDQRFGKSWNVFVRDDGRLFVLEIQEDSRYGTDFLKKLPNLHRGRFYTFKPFDFEKDNKRRVGISITDEIDQRVESYYQKFKKVDDGWVVENINDYPTYDGNPRDAEDLKMYFIRVTKFLRARALEYLNNKFNS